MKQYGRAFVCITLSSIMFFSSFAYPSPIGVRSKTKEDYTDKATANERTGLYVIEQVGIVLPKPQKAEENTEAETETMEVETSETEVIEVETESEPIIRSSSTTLNKSNGVFYYNGFKETYYNLNMSGVVQNMRALGYDEATYPYWVRDDGVKMLGNYVMVAADLNYYPKGTILTTSLGQAIVCDTGSAIIGNVLDIAVTW